MGEIRMGDSVVIENTPLNARITQISQNVNPASQSVLVRAVIAGQTADLRPGQHVNVQLLHASADKLFRLPITALVSHDGQDYVFVRVPDGFAARPVAVAGKEERQAVIQSGLKGDEAVAVQGVAALKASWVGIGSAE
jgi:cobalt-zinc-cadmium efflux system membrane fusion protein